MAETSRGRTGRPHDSPELEKRIARHDKVDVVVATTKLFQQVCSNQVIFFR